MRDLFFTILAIWVIWRIVESIQSSRVTHKDDFNEKSNEGEVKVEYRAPPKKNKDNGEGEYIDYEEIK